MYPTRDAAGFMSQAVRPSTEISPTTSSRDAPQSGSPTTASNYTGYGGSAPGISQSGSPIGFGNTGGLRGSADPRRGPPSQPSSSPWLHGNAPPAQSPWLSGSAKAGPSIMGVDSPLGGASFNTPASSILPPRAPWEVDGRDDTPALDMSQIATKTTEHLDGDGYTWDWDEGIWRRGGVDVSHLVVYPRKNGPKGGADFSQRKKATKEALALMKAKSRLKVALIYFLDFMMDFMGSAPEIPNAWKNDDAQDKKHPDHQKDELLEEMLNKSNWDELAMKIGDSWLCGCLKEVAGGLADVVSDPVNEQNDDEGGEALARIKVFAMDASVLPRSALSKSAAFAQGIARTISGQNTQPERSMDDDFDAMDLNRDGVVDREEYRRWKSGLSNTQEDRASEVVVNVTDESMVQKPAASMAPMSSQAAASPSNMSPFNASELASLNRFEESDSPKRAKSGFLEDEDDDDELLDFQKHIKPVDGVAAFTKIHTAEAFSTLKRDAGKGSNDIQLVSTVGFTAGQILVINAGTKDAATGELKEEINKVRSKNNAMSLARMSNMELMWDLKYEHGAGTTVAVEDFYWECAQCPDGNGHATYNKHADLQCRECGKARPDEITEYDDCLCDVRSRIRRIYGRVLLQRVQDGQNTEEHVKRKCECGADVRANATICKSCKRPQWITCPMPDCNGKVKPGHLCDSCHVKPNEDLVDLSNFTQRVFRSKKRVNWLEDNVNRKLKGSDAKLETSELGLTYNDFAEGLQSILKQIHFQPTDVAKARGLVDHLGVPCGRCDAIRIKRQADRLRNEGEEDKRAIPECGFAELTYEEMCEKLTIGRNGKPAARGGPNDPSLPLDSQIAVERWKKLTERPMPKNLGPKSPKSPKKGRKPDEPKEMVTFLGMCEKLGLDQDSDQADLVWRELEDWDVDNMAQCDECVHMDKFHDLYHKAITHQSTDGIDHAHDDALHGLEDRLCLLPIDGWTQGCNLPIGHGLDVRNMKQLIGRLMPFLRASKAEVDSFWSYYKSTREAAVPWCLEHDKPQPGFPRCPKCVVERRALAQMLDTGHRKKVMGARKYGYELHPSTIKVEIPKKPTRPKKKPPERLLPENTALLDKTGDSASAKVAPEQTGDDDDDADDKEVQRLKKIELRKKRKERWEMERIKNQQVWPVFIFAQSFVAAALWFYYAVQNYGADWMEAEAGLDSMAVGATTLKTHYDCNDLRGEIYRYWTYQFTHFKFSHIFGNVVMNLFLGMRLNKLNGNAMMALFYWLGVLGGACAYFIWNVHETTLGMSGGCYSLLGQRYGYLAINWKQKRYAKSEFTLLTLMIVIEFVLWLKTMMWVDENPLHQKTTHVSHSVHGGGFFMGLMLVVLFGANLEETTTEKKAKCFAFIIFVLFIGFCVIFRLSAWAPWDLQNTDGYCWLQLVYNSTIFNDTKWHCIQCSEKGCPEHWKYPNQQWTANVTYSECVKDHAGFCEVDKAGRVGRCFEESESSWF